MEQEKVQFSIEIWDNANLTNPVPWTIIRTEDSMNFFFAKDKLFKIYVDKGFEGQLSNGISIGSSMDEVRAIDPDIKFNEWEEDWNSPKGYWIEDELDNDTVATITVFIKEVIDDDLFEKYEW